jgi:hypothetical protein
LDSGFLINNSGLLLLTTGKSLCSPGSDIINAPKTGELNVDLTWNRGGEQAAFIYDLQRRNRLKKAFFCCKHPLYQPATGKTPLLFPIFNIL